jgi:putative ABC transport system permease protein
MLVWLEDARRDLQYTFRRLGGAPGFTAVAILTLALGIGATTAIFSIVHALLLKPLPYKDADRLVRFPLTDGGATHPTVAEVIELRRRTNTLSHAACFFPHDTLTLTGQEATAHLEGWRAEPAIFEMLGVQPLLGRLFDASDAAPGADAVIILSYTMWQRRFGGDPSVLGRTLILDGEARSVIGVMPQGFEFPYELGRWEYSVPLVVDEGSQDIALPMMARLARDVSIQGASTEVSGILREIKSEERSYRFVRIQEELVAPVKRALLMLTVAVGFVLLIACVNTANLLLARTSARQREIAIRSALGAGRGRMIRHLLTESVMLALLGGVGGTLLAFGGIRLLRALATTLSRMDLGVDIGFPRLSEVTIDAPVLVFTLATAVITGVLFGAAPAFRCSRPGHMDLLREGTTFPFSGFGLFGRYRVRGLLVVVEIALAMTLLIGGGLLMRSFITLVSVDLGYEPANVLTFQVAMPKDRYPGEQIGMFAEDLVARLRSTPGIEAAAYAPLLPMVTLLEHTAWFRRTPVPPSQPPARQEDLRGVSQDYFTVMGIRVVAGRAFDEHDRAGRARVLVINDALARRDFPGANPIGETVYLVRDRDPWQIVGVVEDVRQAGLDEEPRPQVFVDSRQWRGMAPGLRLLQYYAVRTSGDPMAVISSVRSVLHNLDPQTALYNVAPMSQIVSNSITRPRLYAVFVSIFAGVAVALAAIGIYGTMAYSVAQRTREIGIRMALGAQRAEVMRLVLGQTLVLTVVGILGGISGAAAVTRYLEGMLFGLTPLDPATFITVSVLFTLVATIASYLPARRATRVDPLIALREE